MARNKQRVGPPKSDVGVANHDIDTALDVTRRFRDAGLERPTVAEASLFLADGQGGPANTVKNKLYSAAKFGFLEFQLNRETRLQEIVLPPLGAEALDPLTARAAKVRAFLNVELNRVMYARYRDRRLPTYAELDHILSGNLGVIEKQRQHVRRTFIRSASQAGFFEHGHERLVLPSDVPFPLDVQLPDVSDLPDVATFDVEDGMEQLEDSDPSPATERTNGAVATRPVAVPEAQHTRIVATTAPPAGRPVLRPEIIEFWRESEPRLDASKAKWKKWLNWLNDALDLRGDDEDHRA